MRTVNTNSKPSKMLETKARNFKFNVNERNGRYQAKCQLTRKDIINAALHLIGENFDRHPALSSPVSAGAYLILKLAEEQREVFACIFLDNSNKPIAFEKLFYGTIDGASVYPREIIKRALELNAASLILTHNHPSGNPKASRADIAITKRIVKAAELVDIRILDHMIVAGASITSFMSEGLL